MRLRVCDWQLDGDQRPVRFHVSDSETTIHVGLRYFLGKQAPAESAAVADSSRPKRLAALP